MHKKWIKALLASSLVLAGCQDEDKKETLTFGTCADYPPFEYVENGVLTGLDIEIAKELAKELGKEVRFENMSFGAILASLSAGKVDAAISTITATPERAAAFDFTPPYYDETISTLSLQSAQIANAKDLEGKRVACQMGATTQMWLAKHVPSATLLAFDTTNQAVEAVKARQCDAALVDTAQASAFQKVNPELTHALVGETGSGYAIATKKGSKLTKELTQAMARLKEKGVLKELVAKWIG
ncbi:MAG: amino acid ABC transporter substrate-binding protein [Candidatus Puniceispirillum sp.]|nr:amino acid ABC transporter substrate-binding protein [Candidatus Puniceispirillum sp.]